MRSATSTRKPTLDSCVRVNDDVVFQVFHGEAVLLNLKSATYFGLDPVGTRIWQMFARDKRLSEIARTIAAEYDVPEDRCASELLALAEDLIQQGLVTVSGVTDGSLV